MEQVFVTLWYFEIKHQTLKPAFFGILQENDVKSFVNRVGL